MKEMSNKEKFNSIKSNFTSIIPVDIVGLANALGIEVFEIELTDDKISGYISRDENGYFICVNKNHPATRQQFTIAHEIGHFVLHQTLLEDNKILPTVYKLGNGINYCVALPRCDEFLSSEYRQKETEANKFAAELLMPEDKFIEAANKCEDLNELARMFRVSVGAASIRANTLGIEIF